MFGYLISHEWRSGSGIPLTTTPFGGVVDTVMLLPVRCQFELTRSAGVVVI